MAKKKVEVSETHYLGNGELRHIEQIDFDAKIRAKDLTIALAKVRQAKTELTLLSANYTLKSKEVEKLNQEVTAIENQLAESKEKYTQYTTELSEKYNLPTKWGYDPISGEIK